MEPPKINPDSVITSCVTELRRAVINLELAWRGGHLTSALHDLEAACPGVEKVIDVYQSLVTLQYPQHSAAREANLSSILESFEHMLKTPQRWFRAVEAVPSDSPSTGVAFSGIDVDSSAPPSIREISAQGPDGPVPMRIDQVLASRIWGVGFHFESQELAQFVDDALLRKAVNVLTARLRALQKIDLEWRKPAKADVPILFSGAGRLFEDLMVDILNQESLIARRAPLEEDFREKTDLRVYAPGLKRKRGARVQVTQTTDPIHYQEKLSSIRLLNEVVILSPIALAQAVIGNGPDQTNLLSNKELTELWSCFPDRPDTVADLASEIKVALLKALGRATLHPLGPMASVPPPLRILIRNYIPS